MDVLLLLALCGCCLAIFCLSLHCVQHYRCRFCIEYKYRVIGTTRIASYSNCHFGHSRATLPQPQQPHPQRPRTSSQLQPQQSTPISIQQQHLRVSNSVGNHSVTNYVRTPSAHSAVTTPIGEETTAAARSSSKAAGARVSLRSSMFDKYDKCQLSSSSLRGANHSPQPHDTAYAYKVVRRKCRSCVYGVEEDFDFFPAAFLVYVLCALLVMVVIVARLVVLHVYFHHDHSVAALFDDQLFDAHVFYRGLQAHMLNVDAWTHLHRLQVTRYFDYYGSLDWLIAYCVMLLLVWESLFNFYRFFTTMHAAKYFYTLPTKQVLLRYMVYVAAFCVVFLCNVHLYYMLFPITVGLHLVCNLYWTWRFERILMVQYKHIISTDSFMTDVHDNMLSSVYLMRKFSTFACVLSSLFLLLFLVSYDTSVMIYFPILCSVALVSFTLNFVRNRQFMMRQFYRVQHCLIVNNFSLESTTYDLKQKVLTKNRNATRTSSGRHHKTAQSATESGKGKISDLKRRQHQSQLQLHVECAAANHRPQRLRKLSTASTTAGTQATATQYHHHVTAAAAGGGGGVPNMFLTVSSSAGAPQTPMTPMSTVADKCAIDMLPALEERATDMDMDLHHEHEHVIDIEEEAMDADNEEDDEDDESVVQEIHVGIDTDQNFLGTPSSEQTHVTESPLSMAAEAPNMHALNQRHAQNREQQQLHKISITAPSAYEMGICGASMMQYTSATPDTLKSVIVIPKTIRTRSATLNTPTPPPPHAHAHVATTANTFAKNQSLSDTATVETPMAHSDGDAHEIHARSPSLMMMMYYDEMSRDLQLSACSPLQKAQSEFVTKSNAQTQSAKSLHAQLQHTSLHAHTLAYVHAHAQTPPKTPPNRLNRANQARKSKRASNSKQFLPSQTNHSQPTSSNSNTTNVCYASTISPRNAPAAGAADTQLTTTTATNVQIPLSIPISFGIKSCGHTPQSDVNPGSIWQSMVRMNAQHSTKSNPQKLSRSHPQQLKIPFPAIDLVIDTNVRPMTRQKYDDGDFDLNARRRPQLPPSPSPICASHSNDGSGGTRTTKPQTSTPSGTRRKALKLLGIQSMRNRSPEAKSPSAMYHSSSYNASNKLRKAGKSARQNGQRERERESPMMSKSKSSKTKTKARNQRARVDQNVDTATARPSTARFTNQRGKLRTKQPAALPLTPKLSTISRLMLKPSSSQHTQQCMEHCMTHTPVAIQPSKSTLTYRQQQQQRRKPQQSQSLNTVSKTPPAPFSHFTSAVAPYTTRAVQPAHDARAMSPISPMPHHVHAQQQQQHMCHRSDALAVHDRHDSLATMNTSKSCKDKSLSKTLTQSELREIDVYDRDDPENGHMHDTHPQQQQPQHLRVVTPQQSDSVAGYSPLGISSMLELFASKHTYSDSTASADPADRDKHSQNSTVFVSNSYHRDNVSSNARALNQRVLDLLMHNIRVQNMDGTGDGAEDGTRQDIDIDICDIDVVQTPLEEEDEDAEDAAEDAAEEQPSTCQTPVPIATTIENTKRRQKQKQKQTFLQTSSVPPSIEHRQHVGRQKEAQSADLPFDSILDLQKAFSLPNEAQHTQSSSTGTALTLTMSTTVKEIDTHYACNRLEHRNKDSLDSSHQDTDLTAELTEMTADERSQDTPTTRRRKLIGIPSQLDDVIVGGAASGSSNPFRLHMQQHVQHPHPHHHHKQSASTTRGSNASGLTKSKSFGIDSDDEDDDDQTLNTDVLRLNHSANALHDYGAHERNDTNVSVTYNCHESSSTKPRSQQNMCIHIHYDDDDDDDDDGDDDDDDAFAHADDNDGGGGRCFQPMEDQKNDDDDLSLQIDEEDADVDDDDDVKEEEEADYFPSPGDFDREAMMRKGHNTSRSLLDELSKFALNGVFGATSKHSFSNSKSKSNKSRTKMLNDLIQKRRSRSMPSMEELNNDSNESAFEDGNADQEDDGGDIISLLSVLVKHGFYTKTNLNSVQQLTVYNAK